MTQTTLYRLLRLMIVLTVIIFTCFTLFYITQYTYPFMIALILAFMINPIVNFIERKLHLNRAFAVLIAICLVLALIISTITILIVELINGTTYLAEHIPAHFKLLIIFFQDFITQHVIPIYQNLATLLNTLEPSQQDAILTNIQNIGEEIASTGAIVIRNTLQTIHSLLGNLPSYVTVLVFSLLGTFFISKDWYKFTNLFTRLAPAPVTNSSKDVLNGLKKALFGFVKAQITLITITAVIVWIGLIILRVDYAITIAIIAGFIDLLPYLGTGLVFIPWILYMFFSGNFYLTIGLSILYITIVVQRQLMEPKVLSTNIGLNPLATLIALFAGFQLWGLAGLIIGPVLVVVINTFYQTGVFAQLWGYIKGEE
nr:sporulation integral membrane protein YtvI [Aquibacillus sediminis]